MHTQLMMIFSGYYIYFKVYFPLINMQMFYICNTFSTVYLTSVCIINVHSFHIESSNIETMKVMADVLFNYSAN